MISVESVLREGSFMDLKEISDKDLAALLELFRTLATTRSNRVALDLSAIIERESLSRRQSTPIEDYTDNELVRIIEDLTSFVDDGRAKGMPDDHPGARFILENLTALISEAKRRDLIKEPQ